jgi:hypothetical protein
MTRDEWKYYKEFDELRREMTSGFAANNLFGADMTNLSAGSFLRPRDIKRPIIETQSDTPHAE